MKRVLFPLVSLIVAAFSIAVDLYPRQPDSKTCVNGGCRVDQTDALVVSSGATPAGAKALLLEDSADPTMWCAYGEFLSGNGHGDKAQAAFARALELGPGLSPVLMRVANFDFTHDRDTEGLQLVPRILLQTDEFDQLLFSYLRGSGVTVPRLLGPVIPADPRAAASWLEWERRVGTDRDLLDTWAWMRRNGLAEQASAVATASSLWQRKAYGSAQQLWADWLGEKRGKYLAPELLTNTRFEDTGGGSPFDWKLTPGAGVDLTPRDGLQVQFLGKENIEAIGVEQATAVTPGRYRFSAEVSADGISTDQGPFFKISDAEDARRLNAETRAVTGTLERTWIREDFTVTAATHALYVRLARRPSAKFDNKIAGTLQIYQVSLAAIPSS